MILIAVSVHDSAAGAFNRPMFVPSTGLAVRSFRDEVNRNSPENPMFAHPDDFSLYVVGLYNDGNGALEGQAPELLARAKDLKE